MERCSAQRFFRALKDDVREDVEVRKWNNKIIDQIGRSGPR